MGLIFTALALPATNIHMMKQSIYLGNTIHP
jgi:hypothetical protein